MPVLRTHNIYFLSQLLTLLIDIPGDLVWDLPCMQQASHLEGGPLLWMLSLYLHINQKDDDDDDDDDDDKGTVNVLKFCTPKLLTRCHMQTGAVWSGSILFAITLSILRNNCRKSKI